MPHLNRDGVQIYYEVHGDGPALLMSHGYSATSQMWAPQIDALSESHTLIIWDMRGHGQSDSPRDEAAYSAALTVDDMSGLLDHLGFDKAVVGGLSLGGYMSLAFHLHNPERVAALLIIDTGPGFKKDSAREMWNKTALDRAKAIERDGADAFEGRSPEQVAASHKDLAGLVYAAKHMLTQRNSRVIESLPNIAVPTIVIAGAQDTPFLAATDYMATKIPNAEKVIVADAGHAVNLDQPRVFSQTIKNFLASNNL